MQPVSGLQGGTVQKWLFPLSAEAALARTGLLLIDEAGYVCTSECWLQ